MNPQNNQIPFNQPGMAMPYQPMIAANSMPAYPQQIPMQVQPRLQQQVNTRDIFIKNLDDGYTEDDVKQWGNEYGVVTSVKFFPKNGWKNVIVSMTEDSRPDDFIADYNGKTYGSRSITVSFMKAKDDLQRVQGQSVVVRIIGLPEVYSADDMASYIKENDLDDILDSNYPYPITVRPDARPQGSRTNGSRSQGYIHCKSEEKARIFIKYLNEHQFTHNDQTYELRADPLPKRNSNVRPQQQNHRFQNQGYQQNFQPPPRMNFVPNPYQPIPGAYPPNAFGQMPFPPPFPPGMPMNKMN